MFLSTRAPLASSQSSFCCCNAARLAQRARPSPTHAASRSAVVAMTKPSKAADLRSLSDEELSAEVYKSKRAMFDLRVAQKTRQAYKSSDFGWHSKKIAQLLTIKREREIEQGVNKRESRRKDRKEKLALGFGNH